MSGLQSAYKDGNFVIRVVWRQTDWTHILARGLAISTYNTFLIESRHNLIFGTNVYNRPQDFAIGPVNVQGMIRRNSIDTDSDGGAETMQPRCSPAS